MLIVLSILIVGIAIAFGVHLFRANAVETNRNAVISDLFHLGFRAQSYFRRPTSYGGGNGATFSGFVVPPLLTSNDNGTFSIPVDGTAVSVTIQAVGTEIGEDQLNPIKYQLTAYSASANFTLQKDN